jgi:twinkle protein
MVKDYYSDNFYHILPENDFTIDTILSRARALIKQKGIKILVIDPYNTIEHKRQNGMTEHEYISMFLDVLRNFAKRNNIIIFLVAHPTKMKKEQGIFEVPDMYSISGSSNFYNKTDFGMTVYLNSGGITEIHVNKVKFKHLGQKGIAYFQWEYSNGRYYERIDGMPHITDNKNLIEKQEIIQDYEPNKEFDAGFDTKIDPNLPF